MSRFGGLMVAAVILVLVGATAAFGQERSFSGLYGGFEVGSQHIVAGALVDGMDLLAEDDRVVSSLVGGFRYEFGSGFVIGAEGTYGFFDGDLGLSDPANDLDITYETGHQTTVGAIVGFSFGAPRNWLAYGFVSEATRQFDVVIRQQGTTFTQRDEQGMLRYGLGLERHFSNGLHVRASVGTGRADFGDRQTNIEPDEPIELAVGVLYQF